MHDNARQNFPSLCFSLGKAAVCNAIEGDTRDSTTSDNSAQSSLYKKPNHVRFEGFIMNNNFSVFSSSFHRSLACALIFYLLLFYIFSRRSYCSFLPLLSQLQLLDEEIPIPKTARGFQFQSLHEKSLIEFVIWELKPNPMNIISEREVGELSESEVFVLCWTTNNFQDVSRRVWLSCSEFRHHYSANLISDANERDLTRE